MEVYERLKYIREDLGMSRAAFGSTLGVSGDVINNIERGRVELKEYMIRLVCKTHRVNYFWLTEEKGEPYIGPPDILIDDVIEEYVKLKPETRAAIKEYILQIFKRKAPE